MSEGCPGCFQSVRGQQQLLEATKLKAKEYAVEQNKTMAIYKEGYEYYYCGADIATESGYAIVCFVSPDH